MAWKEDIDNVALDAAEKYYDEVLVGLGMFPSELRRLPPIREDAIVELARNVVGEVENKFPESSYDEGQANILNNSKASENMKWLFGYGVDPVVAKEQKDFNTMRRLINPDTTKNEKKWTDMSKQELEHVMQQFGFDSRKEGDYNKFINLVAQHQLNFDRGQVVRDEMSTPYGVMAAITAPTATQEAIKQSLTGAYDDSKLNTAKNVDIIASSLLGGATRLNPMSAAVTGLVTEGARQGVNKYLGNDIDPWAPFASAIGTFGIKGGGRTITSKFANSNSRDVSAFAKGMKRGIRGFEDSAKAEENALKDVLKGGYKKSNLTREDARKKLSALGFRSAEDEAALNNAILNANEQVNVAKNNLSAVRNPSNETQRDALLRSLDEKYSGNAYSEVRPVVQRELTGSDLISSSPEWANTAESMGVSIDDLAKQLSGIQPIADRKLKRGYREVMDSFGNKRVVKTSDLKTIRNTPNEVFNPYPHLSAKEALSTAKHDYNKAESALNKANKAKEDYMLNSGYFGVPESSRPYVEQILGDPTGSLPQGASPMSVREAIEFYKRPIGVEKYSNPSFERETKLVQNTFPEKVEKELGESESKGWYNTGLHLGKGLGNILSPIEASYHVYPTDLWRMLTDSGKFAERNSNFRDSEWYKKLDEQKKAAIERALQGAR